MKVTIKGVEYEFAFDSVWGPMYLYEEMTDVAFEPKKTRCMHLMFYAILMLSNSGMTLTLEEFILALNDVQLAKSMMEYYTQRMAVLTTGARAEVEQPDEDGKKKD
jgi:hypothetical protein